MYLTVTEAAHKLGVSEAAVKKLIKADRLEAVNIANAWRIRPEDLNNIAKGPAVGYKADGSKKKPARVHYFSKEARAAREASPQKEVKPPAQKSTASNKTTAVAPARPESS
jgi:excisionase family DNA binding protein